MQSKGKIQGSWAQRHNAKAGETARRAQRQSNIGAQPGNPVSGSFSWIDYADPAATYTLMASAEIDAVAVTLSASVLAQIQPVNSYV